MIELPLTLASYQHHYQRSITTPELFWAEQATHYLDWLKPWQQVTTGSFTTGDVRWFNGGYLNACYNCVDRHLATRADQTAILWEGNDPQHHTTLTYRQLHQAICQWANILKQYGIKKGDRVCIYLPMIVEAAIAMLACARIGAIHSVVFAGFSPQALASRIQDADCRVVITADEGRRGHKVTSLKDNCDQALQDCPQVTQLLVVKNTGAEITWQPQRDIWLHEVLPHASTHCDCEPMAANDPLFILYTSGSTGKPKGVLHATGGYLLYATMTHHLVFNYQSPDVYWCTADVGWITGHSYMIYGPLANGATTLLFEGIPTYPDPSRYWQIIDKHHVNIFYTAPTAIRALLREGDDYVKTSSRKSLKLLGTVGEPINPEVWQWYHQVVGNGQCPIVDTWWQTETGGIMITPFANATPPKPGAACQPFFGIKPAIVNDEGHHITDTTAGKLIITQPWPGLMQTIFGDHQRFIETYFSTFKPYYFTGDGAHRDKDGDYWISGRVDDVINVSGHRLGTAEIESALVAHHSVCEAAVVGYPHPIKGQGIYAFVTLKKNANASNALKSELISTVRNTIGPIAHIDTIHWANALPKTRSGKIMRRILRQIAQHQDQLGDTSTLANPEVIQDLLQTN